MPDIKYFSDELAVKYSSAPHYFDTAINALGFEGFMQEKSSADSIYTPVFDSNSICRPSKRQRCDNYALS